MRNKQAKCFLVGIPVLFMAGSFLHFAYGLSGGLPVIGFIAPVNESVFEHIKMIVLPTILWYGIIYLCRRKKISAGPWFTAVLLAIGTSVAVVLLLYYFYTGAFGLKSLAADILTFLAAVALGQSIGLHSYRRGKGLDPRLAIALLSAVLIAFGLLTLFPPHLPLFLDPITKAYGMNAAV